MAAASGVMLTINDGLANNRWILLVAAGGAIAFYIMDSWPQAI